MKIKRNEKPLLEVSAFLDSTDEIKGLLPDIAILKKKYSVNLTLRFSEVDHSKTTLTLNKK